MTSEQGPGEGEKVSLVDIWRRIPRRKKSEGKRSKSEACLKHDSHSEHPHGPGSEQAMERGGQRGRRGDQAAVGLEVKLQKN